MKKTAVVLMLIALISKVIGLFRDICLSFFYGASIVSDVYLVANTIAIVLFSIVLKGVSTGFIPMYQKIEFEANKEGANRFTINIINVLLVLATGFFVFGFIFTEQLVRVFASGFEGDNLKLAVSFTRIVLVSMFFYGLNEVFAALLELHNKFVITAFYGITGSVITIIFIYISYQTNILLFAFGLVAASISQFLLLYGFGRKYLYKYSPTISLKDPHLRELIRMAIPVMIGVSLTQINNIIDNTIASQIVIGGISSLNYAGKVSNLVNGIFVETIVVLIFPFISKMAAEDNIVQYKKTIANATIAISLFLIPAAIGCMILAEPIVQLLFGRGAFDDQAIMLTSGALYFYAFSMIGYGLRDVFARGFYAIHDTKTPMVISAFSMIMNIILNIILSRCMGLNGLALATSISTVFCAIVNMFFLRRKVGALGMKKILLSVMKIVFATSIMAVCVKLIHGNLVMIHANLALFFSIIAGVLIYFILLVLVKVEEVQIILNQLKLRFKR